MSASPDKPAPRGPLATNRKARRDFHVLETFECGVELVGTEVKSIRAGKLSLAESYARVEDGQMLVHGLRIEPYTHGNQFNHDPLRPKRLLLHRKEIDRLALARGKDVRDKRETLRRRTADREAQRAIAEHKGR